MRERCTYVHSNVGSPGGALATGGTVAGPARARPVHRDRRSDVDHGDPRDGCAGPSLRAPQCHAVAAAQSSGDLAVTVEVDGRRYTRCYSPANAEGSALIELTITRHDGGTVSGFLFRNGRPGLVVGLSGPAGDFVLPDRRPNRMLFIAGGSGITPVLAMLRTLQSGGFGGTAALLYYTRTPEDACYRDELVGLGIPVHHIHTRDIHTRDRVAGDLTGRGCSPIASWVRSPSRTPTPTSRAPGSWPRPDSRRATRPSSPSWSRAAAASANDTWPR